MMSTFDDARWVFFRVLLGDEPVPHPAALSAIQRFLGSNLAFCAALDDLVSIIVCNKRTVEAGWRTRLQAYVSAQLEGRGDEAGFADIRQQLDASVDLSEEYALLYEIMQVELHGAVPIPEDIPAPDFGFLAEPAASLASTPTVPAAAAWLHWPALSGVLLGLAALGSLLTLGFLWQSGVTRGALLVPLLLLIALTAALGWQWTQRQTATQPQLYRLGSVLQSTLLLACIAALVVGLWAIMPGVGAWFDRDAAIATEPIQPTPRSFLELQMGLEATLPTPLAIYEAQTTPLADQSCIGYLRGLLFRKACPL